MARPRDRAPDSTPAERDALDEAGLAKRYRTLSMFGMAADPAWPMSAALLGALSQQPPC